MNEVRMWIIQQCNVYGSCNVRTVRFQQEFGQDEAAAEQAVNEFCRANQLTVQFVLEKSHYVFRKAG